MPTTSSHVPHATSVLDSRPNVTQMNQASKTVIQDPHRRLPNTTSDILAGNQDPSRPTPLNPSTRNSNPNSKSTYALVLNPASILNPSASLQPHKSFLDAVKGCTVFTILVKPTLLHRGEPAVLFSAEEVKAMAKPFKQALVGKFCSGRPSMDVIRKFFVSLGLKGNCQVSLLDNLLGKYAL